MYLPDEQQVRRSDMWRKDYDGIRWRSTGFWSYRVDAEKMRVHLSTIGVMCKVETTADGKYMLVTDQRPFGEVNYAIQDR